MIKIRGGYSDTAGLVRFNVNYQLNEFDRTTRTHLSNKTYEILQLVFEGEVIHYKYSDLRYENGVSEFCKEILSEVFVQRTNLRREQSYDWVKLFENINDIFENAPYNEILDLLWYILNWIYSNMNVYQVNLFDLYNGLFEKEFIGYRFVDRRIVAITDQNEINSIEDACNSAYAGVNSHMQKAVGFIADRENPDYKNAIKESISAVESICRIVAQNEKATLGQALKVIKNQGVDIHPALERAFLALYGYTSDKGGIRHCEGMFESDVSFDEAKFMLVSCSAFINYLISESESDTMQ